MAAIKEHYPEVAPDQIPMQVGVGVCEHGSRLFMKYRAWELTSFWSSPSVCQAPEHFDLEATTRAIEVSRGVGGAIVMGDKIHRSIK